MADGSRSTTRFLSVKNKARLAVDIGGTFTDVVLETAQGARFTAKVLTTPQAPEEGVLTGVKEALAKAGLAAGDVGVIIHGTTLATNALIERRGAKVEVAFVYLVLGQEGIAVAIGQQAFLAAAGGGRQDRKSVV